MGLGLEQLCKHCSSLPGGAQIEGRRGLRKGGVVGAPILLEEERLISLLGFADFI